MANPERGFRRLTLAVSMLLILLFLVVTIPSFLARQILEREQQLAEVQARLAAISPRVR
jgi:hypothetical protein